MELPPAPSRPFVRRGKELVERGLALVAAALAGPIFVLCAIAIKLEGLFRPDARGPILFREQRIARGRVISMLKFRVLTSRALRSLGEGPTHIATLERAGELTLVGRLLKQWYLDELPQLINIVRGDIGLIGTRPYPIELYLEEMERGITRKRDMPAGLIGPVQAAKGDPAGPDGIQLDAEYWDAYQRASVIRLATLDIRIILKSIRVQLEHKGI